MKNSKLLKMNEDYTTGSGIELKKNGVFHVINPLRDELIQAGKADVYDPSGVLSIKEVKKLTQKSK